MGKSTQAALIGGLNVTLLTSLRRAFSLYLSKASDGTGWRTSALTSVDPGLLQFSQRQPCLETKI